MRVGKPGVDRPHRHLHREGGEERQEQPHLRLRREVVGHQIRYGGRAGRARHVEHGDQHQHRSEQRVEEEFVARVDPPRAAPDADDHVHRDQAALEHDVEQEQILRHEHAEHQQLGEQKHGHIFRHALRDRFPRGDDADRHQEDREHDQHQRDAVDAQRPGEAAEHVRPLDELPARSTDLIMIPQHDAETEIDQRRGQRGDARRTGLGLALTGREQAPDGGHHRHRQHDREDGKTELIHLIIVPRRKPGPRSGG